MPSSSTYHCRISLLPAAQSRIDEFLLRFSPAGRPSERSMVKAFIESHVEEKGHLPVGTHVLSVQQGAFGFLGRSIDYSDLGYSHDDSQQTHTPAVVG